MLSDVVLMRNNMPVVYHIQQDIYWYKVLQLCEVSISMIRCYESKKAELSQEEWFEFVRVFENLGGSIDRSYIGVQEILRSRHREHPDSKFLEERLSRVIRNIIHMRYVIMNQFTAQNRVVRNEGLRIQYMRNHITEEHFKTTLQREEKKEEKKREIRNVIDILYTTCTDIVLRFMEHLRTCEAGKWELAILGKIDPIVNYANECLREVSRVYKSKLVEFTADVHMR